MLNALVQLLEDHKFMTSLKVLQSQVLTIEVLITGTTFLIIRLP